MNKADRVSFSPIGTKLSLQLENEASINEVSTGHIGAPLVVMEDLIKNTAGNPGEGKAFLKTRSPMICMGEDAALLSCNIQGALSMGKIILHVDQ